MSVIPKRREFPGTAALRYIGLGWRPIPVRGKGSPPPKWTELEIKPDEISEWFPANRNLNIAVVLGEVSNGLMDIDLDDDLAVALADKFLPSDTARYGHGDGLPQHYFYVTRGSVPTRSFRYEGQKLIEIRGNGAYSLVPPSIHPETGQIYEWDISPEDVREATYDEVYVAVIKLFLAVVLAKAWPPEGSRHDAALALSGALLRMGWNIEEVCELMEVICHAAGDSEVTDRIKTVHYTANRIASGGTATGLPTLSSIVGREASGVVLHWAPEIVEKIETRHTEEIDEDRMLLIYLLERSGKRIKPDEHIAIRQLVESSDSLLPIVFTVAQFVAPRGVFHGHPVTRDGLVMRVVINELARRGRFVRSGPTSDSPIYYVDTPTRKAYSIHTDSFRNFLIEATAASATKDQFRSTLEAVVAHAYNNAVEQKVGLFATFNQESNTVYIYDSEKVWKVTDREIEIVPNGEEALFEEHEGGSPVNEYSVQIPDDVSLDELRNILEYGKASYVDDCLWAVHLIYALAIPFGEFLHARPHEALIGPWGSGKTTLASRLGKILLGPQFDPISIPNDLNSLKVLLNRQPLIVFDNVEYFPDEYFDVLAIASTGGGDKQRLLYTNDQMVSIRYRAWVSLTAVQPAFRRPDLASRLIVMELTHRNNHVSENEPVEDVRQNRGKYFGAYLKAIQKVLQLMPNWSEYRLPEEKQLRTRAFMQFGYLVWDAFGGDADEIDKAFDTVINYQSQFALEDDPAFDALASVLESKNLWGKPLSAREIWNRISKFPGIAKRFKSSRSIPRWIDNIKSLIELMGYEVIIDNTGNVARYTFIKPMSQDVEPPF